MDIPVYCDIINWKLTISDLNGDMMKAGVPMTYSIENEKLHIEIDALGAQMRSIRGNNGDRTEYLWQRNSKYWSDSAINIFPYVARLTDKSYLYHGKLYHMDIHGFFKSSVLDVMQHEKNFIQMGMSDNSETYEQYPWHFGLQVIYRLEDNVLKITYQIENRDVNKMYFGIGGHPGFNVPIEEGLCFEDYG